MNDRHPSGTMTPAPASDAASAHYASYGTQEAQYGDFTTYGGGYETGAFATGAHGTTTFAADPLFGSLPEDTTASHDSGRWNTGASRTLNYPPCRAQPHDA